MSRSFTLTPLYAIFYSADFCSLSRNLVYQTVYFFFLALFQVAVLKIFGIGVTIWQGRTQEFCSGGGGSTNSVEDGENGVLKATEI